MFSSIIIDAGGAARISTIKYRFRSRDVRDSSRKNKRNGGVEGKDGFPRFDRKDRETSRDKDRRGESPRLPGREAAAAASSNGGRGGRGSSEAISKINSARRRCGSRARRAAVKFNPRGWCPLVVDRAAPIPWLFERRGDAIDD